MLSWSTLLRWVYSKNIEYEWGADQTEIEIINEGGESIIDILCITNNVSNVLKRVWPKSGEVSRYVLKLNFWSIFIYHFIWLLSTVSSYYSDVIMGTMASLITSLTSVYSTVHSCADQRKHQSSASLAFVLEIHRRPVISPHKWPVTRKIFHSMTSSCSTQIVPEGRHMACVWTNQTQLSELGTVLMQMTGRYLYIPFHIDGLVQERRQCVSNGVTSCLH